MTCMYSIFRELAIIILSAKFFGLVARKCKAPQVVGEILAGLIIGPCVLNLVQTKELCAEDDDCQVTENRIHKESFLYYKIPRTIYTFLSKTDNREQRDGRSPAALPFIL